jgi:hypothetical protein
MGDLIDRFSGETAPQRPKISCQDFTPMLNMYVFDKASDTDISTMFGNIQSYENEWIELEQIITVIDERADGYQDEDIILGRKLAYIIKADCVFHCLNDANDIRYHSGGNINKALVCADLEIAGV